MTRLARRAVLAGGAAAATAAIALPLLPGTTGFLRRVLSRHFGPEVLEVDGLDDFIADYAAQAGSDDWKKKLASRLYFSLHGDEIYRIAAADAFADRFLTTILTRSNIIAVHRKTADSFEYTDADPWEPTCSLYLSSLAESGS